MKVVQQGPVEGPNLVCVLGWGNRLEHENVQWLFELFTSAEYRVHGIELPLSISDFYAEYLEPVEEYVDGLESYRLVGHSTGGLIGPYLTGAETETYLSPWWGFRESDFPLGESLLAVLSRLPVARRIIPKGRWDGAELGALVTDQQLADSPRTISPTFIREARSAQRHRPSIPEDAIVFCSLTDEIVSIRAIGDSVPPERTVLYEGGHELFSSANRTDYTESLLAAVDDGVFAL